MRYALLLKASAAMLLSASLASCVSMPTANDVPPCERLIPPHLLAPVPGAEIPVPRNHPDGHEDAQPWQEGFFDQSVQKEKSDERAPAVDHIYRKCLELHREALKRSQRGFFGRLFGG